MAPELSTRPTPAGRARSQSPVTTPRDENVPPGVNPNTLVSRAPAKYANTSAKRRKLDTEESSTSIRSTVSSLPTARRDIYSLEEDRQPVLDAAETTNGLVDLPAIPRQTADADMSQSPVPQTVRRFPTPASGVEEITESPRDAPGSGHRTRTTQQASLQTSKFEDKLQLTSLEGSPTSQRKRKRAKSMVAGTVQSRRTHRPKPRAAAHNANDLDEVDELSPDQPRRGRRRRSSIQQESMTSPVIAEPAEEREAAEEIHDIDAATVLKKIRGHRMSKGAPTKPSPDLDEPSELIGAFLKKRRIQPQSVSSPAIQRQPKKASRKAKTSKNQAKKQIRASSPIPITVHRLTSGPTYEEGESDADVLNSEIPYSQRAGVNVIDVLNKLCTEIIDSALEILRDNTRNTQDRSLKREYRTKHRVVEIFGREFQNRLLEHVSIYPF